MRERAGPVGIGSVWDRSHRWSRGSEPPPTRRGKPKRPGTEPEPGSGACRPLHEPVRPESCGGTPLALAEIDRTHPNSTSLSGSHKFWWNWMGSWSSGAAATSFSSFRQRHVYMNLTINDQLVSFYVSVFYMFLCFRRCHARVLVFFFN